MTNERLRAALRRRSLNLADLASATQVDPKTVERWLAGRTPHPRHRRAVADLLLQEETYLWSEVTADDRVAERHVELVTLYPDRPSVPKELWRDLLCRSRRCVDILAFAALFLPEQDPALVEGLRCKAESGAVVRIALGDPQSEAVELRGHEEGLGEGMAARIAMTFVHLRPLLGLDGLALRTHGTTLYNSIFRFDDEMLVNTHLYGSKAYQNPVMHLRRVDGGSLFAGYERSFERVWEQAAPYAT